MKHILKMGYLKILTVELNSWVFFKEKLLLKCLEHKFILISFFNHLISKWLAITLHSLNEPTLAFFFSAGQRIHNQHLTIIKTNV